MFGQAGHTPYDVRFELLGTPIRIHPIFWLSSGWLVWDGNEPARVFIGVLCVLLSVLVHELGHALVARRYGFPSEIVLYFLGGYATATRFSTWKNVKVSAAGPAAGLVFFGITYVTLIVLGITQPDLLTDYDIIRYAIFWLLFMNLMWSIINLVPCLPLDGGQIMQSLIRRYSPRGAELRIVRTSMVAAGAVAVWSFWCMQHPEYDLIPIPSILLPGLNVSLIQPDPKFLIIFFGYLCARQIMAHNEMQGHR